MFNRIRFKTIVAISILSFHCFPCLAAQEEWHNCFIEGTERFSDSRFLDALQLFRNSQSLNPNFQPTKDIIAGCLFQLSLLHAEKKNLDLAFKCIKTAEIAGTQSSVYEQYETELKRRIQKDSNVLPTSESLDATIGELQRSDLYSQKKTLIDRMWSVTGNLDKKRLLNLAIQEIAGFGSLASDEKDFLTSIIFFEKAQSLDPKNKSHTKLLAGAFYCYGTERSIQGDYVTAWQCYKRTLALDPENKFAPVSLNRIGKEADLKNLKYLGMTGSTLRSLKWKANSIEPKINPSAIAENKPIKDKWALVIGIGNYQDPSVPKLKFADKDAKDFAEFLTTKCNFKSDHVRLLLNEKATQRRILEELGDKFLPRVVREGDLVVIYISGHGSPSGADVRDKNYLVAYDSSKSSLFASGIEMQELTYIIKKRVETDRILLVLDACHSGGIDSNAKNISENSNFDASLLSGAGQMVICSSEKNQRSWESMRYQNGIFTKKLIEALQKNGAETKLKEAFEKLRDEVRFEVREDQGTKQIPILKSEWNGDDLMLAAPPSEERPLPDSVRQALSQ